jgi:hypothetical protein
VPETRIIPVGGASGRIAVKYDTGSATPDRILVTYEGRALFDSGCVTTGGARLQPLAFNGTATTATVHVIPNCAGGTGGAEWSVSIACSPP